MEGGAGGVSFDAVKESLERQRTSSQITGYMIYEVEEHVNAPPTHKQLAKCGSFEAADPAASECLVDILRSCSAVPAENEQFRRLTVTYPDSIYGAVVIGKYQVGGGCNQHCLPGLQVLYTTVRQ
eukprot:Sspe_Gene.39643::Locus_19114_Transcript_1_1_Confidence_1.000_Length_830::g.39643::m.39643